MCMRLKRAVQYWRVVEWKYSDQMVLEFIIDSNLWHMEKQFYHSRLDKAKQALMASKRDQSSGSEHKKKKKHKDNRPSRSASRHSRDKKKPRSRSKDSRQRKHKKHHKHHSIDASPKRKEHRDQRKDERDDRKPHPSKDYRDQRSKHIDKEAHHQFQRGRDERRDYDRDRNRDKYNDRDNRDNRDNRDRRRDRDYRDNDKDFRGRKQQQKPVEQKDPYYERRRQIEKVRRSDTEKAQQMENQLQKQMIFDQKEKELQEAKQKFRQAQKQMQQAKREDLTILVYCLPLKAKEKDIWNFFFRSNSGKIRDIRIIRDARSGRSKGVAYVEFYNSESVQRALAMSDYPFELKGRQFMGLRVQHSQAEKNRAAAAAKQMRVIKPADPIQQQQEQLRRQTKVFVGGLVEKLSQISQKDLKQLFEPFGEIEYVDIHRDPQTGVCKGFAFIQYVDPEKAKVAVKQMNNLEIGNQKISVQIMTVQQKGEISASDQYLYNAGSKANLMNKLSGVSGPSYSNLMRPPISTVTTPYLIMTNMFKMEGTTPAFFDDLKREVQKESEGYGVIERIFIEKNNQGNIWIKYSDTESARKAQQSLNGKFFDGHKIFCYFVTENTYQTRVGI